MSTSLSLATACLLLFAPPEADAPAPTPAGTSAGFAPVEIQPPPPRVAFETFEADPIGVKQVVLANGLTVLLSENHERPEVFGAVVVRTGGKNDPPDNTGLAHYLEHMLFKGTQRLGTTNWAAEQPLQDEIVELYERHERATSDEERAKIHAEIGRVVGQTYAYVIPNELDRMLEELGGTDINATTDNDTTAYFNMVPASQLETWLEIYAHRFEDPVFRLFPTELEAVYEEKNISLDRFEAELMDQLLAGAFPEHPYGTQTVIGEIEHLERPSLEAMRAYFDEYYVANNMALILAGDFDAEAILPIIEAQFGAWRSGPEPEQRGGTVEPFEGRELLKLRVTPLRVGAFAFRTPHAGEPDYAALQVVHRMLSNEQGSGVVDQLVEDGKLMMAFPMSLEFADHGLDVVLFAPRVLCQTFKNAENRVRAQFERLAGGDFDERHMLAIRDGLVAEADRQWEANDERAFAMADSFIAHGGWQGYLDYRAQLASVTREDVMRVAASYFGEDHLALRSRVGFPKPARLSKPSYPAVEPQPGAHSSFYEEVMARPSPVPSLHFVDFEADVTTTPIRDGVVLRTNPNPFNDTYTLRLGFGVGVDRIRELDIAPDYIARLGTRQRSPAQLREQLSLLGTTMAISATWDRTIVSLEGPERHLGEVLALVDELLREPVGDRKRWNALRREKAGFEKVQRRDPAQLVDALAAYAIYGSRSPALLSYGRKGLRKLDPDDLLAAWQRAQDYALEIRYTGQRTPAEVAAIVDDTLTLDRPRQPAVPYLVFERQLPARDTVYFLERRKQVQTQLWFVVDGEPVAREQIAAAHAYDAYMGAGMTGVVFQEVREYRALAYSAWGRFLTDMNPEQAGYFMGGIGCQADKTFEAIDVMLGLIRELPAKPDRMPALRSALLHRLETVSPPFRALLPTIRHWEQRGYDSDPRRELLDDYATLEFADIEAFHAAQLDGRPVTIAVVGDPRVVDVDELARYGEVITLDERDIFSP